MGLAGLGCSISFCCKGMLRFPLRGMKTRGDIEGRRAKQEGSMDRISKQPENLGKRKKKRSQRLKFSLPIPPSEMRFPIMISNCTGKNTKQEEYDEITKRPV